MHLGELLAEAIPESLKNMLLVMSTSGVFKHEDSRDALWELTWIRIRQFLPGLHAAMYPEQRPAPPPLRHGPVPLVPAPAPLQAEFVLGPPLAVEPSAPDRGHATIEAHAADAGEPALHPHPIIV